MICPQPWQALSTSPPSSLILTLLWSEDSCWGWWNSGLVSSTSSFTFVTRALISTVMLVPGLTLTLAWILHTVGTVVTDWARTVLSPPLPPALNRPMAARLRCPAAPLSQRVIVQLFKKKKKHQTNSLLFWKEFFIILLLPIDYLERNGEN